MGSECVFGFPQTQLKTGSQILEHKHMQRVPVYYQPTSIRQYTNMMPISIWTTKYFFNFRDISFVIAQCHLHLFSFTKWISWDVPRLMLVCRWLLDTQSYMTLPTIIIVIWIRNSGLETHWLQCKLFSTMVAQFGATSCFITCNLLTVWSGLKA